MQKGKSSKFSTREKCRQKFAPKYKIAYQGNAKPGCMYEKYNIPSSILVEMKEEKLLKNWSGNRETDMDRIESIRAWQNEIGRVLGMIHLAYIEGEGLVCYDGGHRLMALEKGLEVTIEILWDVTDEITKKYFDMINENEKVTELHKEEKLIPAKDMIEGFMKLFFNTFKGIKSVAPNPARPWLNQTKLETRLTELYTSFVLEEEKCSLQDLFDSIMFLNRAYKNDWREMKYTCKKKALIGRNKSTAETAKFYLNSPAEFLSDDDVDWAIDNRLEYDEEMSQ